MKRKAFTLIELLVVIAIIAILSTIILIGLNGSQSSSRDSRRVADLNQVESDLELYYSNCGFYPGPAQTTGGCSLPFNTPPTVNTWPLLTASLKGSSALAIPSVPNDPETGRNYFYGTNSDGSSYIIAAQMDSTSSAVFKNYVPPPDLASYNAQGLTTCNAPFYCQEFLFSGGSQSTFNCVNNKCVAVKGNGGSFTSQASCSAVCGVVAGYPPTITSLLSETLTVGQPFVYDITASNCSPVCYYGATNLPSWLSFNASKGELSGTPTTATSYNVTISAGNGTATDTETLALTVNNVGAPVITSPLSESATVNQAFNYTITATNCSTTPCTYNATNLPKWLVFSSASASLSGTPTASGTYTATISASNAGGTDTETLTISVGSTVTTGGNGGTTTGNFFVATDGNDSWKGDLAAPNSGNTDGPFADIATAKTAVENLLKGGYCTGSQKSSPIVVVIRGGTYYDNDLSFGSQDNGCSASAPVIYENYLGEAPIISGGNLVSGWAVKTTGICAGVQGTCWQATLPSGAPVFDALYDNGVREYRPRAGATASNLIGEWGRVNGPVGGSGNSAFTYKTGAGIMTPDTSWGADQVAGDIIYWDFEQWVVNVQRVKSISNTTITSECSGNTCPGGNLQYGVDARYMMDNVKDLLKYTGQWFLDRTTNPMTLTYINSGANPGATVMVPNKTQVLVATDLQNTQFEGLTFEHDNYTIASGGYQSLQLDFTLPAMVSCNTCTNVVFNGDEFAHTVANGIEFQGASTEDTLENSIVTDIGGYGVKIGPQPNTTDSNNSVPHNITVTQNTIAGVSRFFPSGDGIGVGLANNLTLSYNDIYDTYHDAIEVCKPQGGPCGGDANGGDFNETVDDNNMYNIAQGVTSDDACFYTQTGIHVNGSNCNSQGVCSDSTGNTLTHNSCHDVNDSSVNGDTSQEGYGGHAYYFDQYTGAWTVKDNLAYRTTATALEITDGPQVAGFPMDYENNIIAFANQGTMGSLNCPPSYLQEIIFKNNIVYSTDSSGVDVQRGGFAPLNTADPTYFDDFASNIYYDPNFAYNTAGGAFYYNTYKSGGPICGSKVSVDFSAWQAAGEDLGTKVENPGFVAPTYPSDNFAFTNPAGPGNGFVPFSMSFGKTTHLPQITTPQTMLIASYKGTDWP